MKLFRNVSIAAMMATVSHAAIVTVDSGFSIGITDFGGTSIAAGTGSLQLGYYTTLPDFGSVSQTTDLTSAFQVYAGTTSVFGKSGLDGFFNISADTGTRDFSSDFIGQNIILLAFNADQSEALVYQFAEAFQADPAEPNPSSSQTPLFTLNAANYLFGTNDSTLTGPVAVGAARMGGFGFLTPPENPSTPEPSVVLLGALGALGFLRRRRI